MEPDRNPLAEGPGKPNSDTRKVWGITSVSDHADSEESLFATIHHDVMNQRSRFFDGTRHEALIEYGLGRLDAATEGVVEEFWQSFHEIQERLGREGV